MKADRTQGAAGAEAAGNRQGHSPYYFCSEALVNSVQPETAGSRLVVKQEHMVRESSSSVVRMVFAALFGKLEPLVELVEPHAQQAAVM